MHWLYVVFLFFVFFAALAMMIREGLWTNTLTLCNVVLGGMIAFDVFGAVAMFADEKTSGEYTYLLDFVCLWLTFVLAVSVIRAITDTLSRYRVRFKMPLEAAGSPVVAVITAWILTGIVSASMHVAPLAPDFLNGAIIVEDNWSSPLRPDLQWLRIVGMQRTGPLCDGQIFEDVAGPALNDGKLVLSYSGESKNVTIDTSVSDGFSWLQYFVRKWEFRRQQFVENGGGLTAKRS